MEDSIRLRQCPYCGGRCKVYIYDYFKNKPAFVPAYKIIESNKADDTIIACTQFGSRFGNTKVKTMKEVIDMFNTRKNTTVDQVVLFDEDKK